MRIFLAGIMQGSHVASVLHNQDYRQRCQQLLARHLPHAQLYDPLADHAGSLQYDDRRARQVFLEHNRRCGEEADVVIAYVPEASMGTAIEMWQAYRHGRVVVAVSPLTHNWVIKYCSHLIYRDLDEFEQAVGSGRFEQQLRRLLPRQDASR